ncbi:MAG: ATP phosphoribosyltransferase [Dehalococcoidia bacterium]|nr:ATP phosphoribosyltransferase [Dehalococcoidia bacterium]
MQLKLALPKGQLLQDTRYLLHRSGLEVSGYEEQSRSYRPECRNLPNVFLKVFNEKDIPIQVAVGNYDLGICGQDWVEELLAKYPSSALVKVQNLGYGTRRLWVAAASASGIQSIEKLNGRADNIRIATEYPNLAEAFALTRRFKRFAIFPLWGGAEVYPPESADLALIADSLGNHSDYDLVPVGTILESNACLIAYRPSWESKNMAPLLDRLCATVGRRDTSAAKTSKPSALYDSSRSQSLGDSECVWIAIADGHQQKPTLEFLARAGLNISENPRNPRRPSINAEGIKVKVIRPQDMPLQVANGNFDLAITGEDWLTDHLYRFPSSPVKNILTLGFGRVRIVAVVSKKLAIQNPEDFRAPLRRQEIATLRIASEYVNIADMYAREHHLSPCRLIPTWGASEAFLPEDADLLIENTQTGQTIAQHGLRIIDTLFESSACLIGSTRAADGIKERRIAEIVRRLERTLKEVRSQKEELWNSRLSP